MQKPKGEEERVADNATETPLVSAGLSASSDVSSDMGKDSLTTPLDIHVDGNSESEIPGLDSAACDDGSFRQLDTSGLVSTGLEDFSKEQIKSFGKRTSLSLPTSVSTDRSDELSPKAPASDANSLVSSTATSVGLSHHFVLPKMLAPVINLADDEKDDLQKSAFVRVIEAYKNMSVSGGSHIRSSLLAHLGVEVVICAS